MLGRKPETETEDAGVASGDGGGPSIGAHLMMSTVSMSVRMASPGALKGRRTEPERTGCHGTP